MVNFGDVLDGAFHANRVIDYMNELTNKKDKATDEDYKRVYREGEKIDVIKHDKVKKKHEEEGYFDEEPKRAIEYFKELFIKHDNPQEDILYKENKNIPQSEIDRASKYAWFEGRDKELNRRISSKVSSWYDEVYGNEKAARDATGRLINLKAKYSLPQKEKPLLSKDGRMISESYSTLASIMAKYDEKKHVSSGSMSLQQALNKYPYQPQLKEDGVVGEKTVSRVKQVLAEQGLSSLLKLIGY